MTNLIIEQADLTEGTLNGAGTFDVLMASVKAHLMEEFNANRISGAAYANVYLGSINTTMQEAIQFELGRYTAMAQTDLINAQVRKTEAEIIQTEKQNDLMDKQIEKMTHEITLMLGSIALQDAQIINMGYQNQVLEQQVLESIQKVLVAQEQVLNMRVQRDQMLAEIVMLDKQAEKLDEDILTARQQVLLITAQVALTEQQVINLRSELTRMEKEIELMTQKILTAQEEVNVTRNTALKIEAETDYTEQRTVTERAQVYDYLADGITAIAGSVGKQNLVYQRQADGFIRDAEQRAAKIYTDMWSIAKSADADGVFNVEVLGSPSYRPEVDSDGNTIQVPFVTDGGQGWNKVTEVLNILRDGINNP